jgi:hypothetical protein
MLSLRALSVKQQAGLDQLWYVSYPGGEVRRITTDLASNTGVSLSADAGLLVTTQIDHPLNIWVLPEGDSSRARPITSGRYFIAGLCFAAAHGGKPRGLPAAAPFYLRLCRRLRRSLELSFESPNGKAEPFRHVRRHSRYEPARNSCTCGRTTSAFLQ